MRKMYFTIPLVILIVGFGGRAIYAAGIPDTIGGYSIVAVLTDAATAAKAAPRAESGARVNPPMVGQPCMMPGEKRLVPQSPHPTIEDALRDFSRESIEQELQALNLPEYAQSGWAIVGPGVNRKQLVSQSKQSAPFFKAHGCITLGSPWITDHAPADNKKVPSHTTAQLAAPASCLNQPPVEGERKCTPPKPGWAVIQNDRRPSLSPRKEGCDIDIDPNIKYNAQSIYLSAPAVGSNQDKCESNVNFNCYSAFLNNVLTDKDYFLQAGLTFIGRGRGLPSAGIVVWTDSSQGTKVQLFNITYHEYHDYWTTITFTSGVWGMCALDTIDSATYQCISESKPDIGTYLKKDTNTSVWAENFNKNADWHQGFNPNWYSYGAKIYVDGAPHDWLRQEATTVDACSEQWLPGNAIGGDLRSGKTGYFKTAGLPLYCWSTVSVPAPPSNISVSMTSGGSAPIGRGFGEASVVSCRHELRKFTLPLAPPAGGGLPPSPAPSASVPTGTASPPLTASPSNAVCGKTTQFGPGVTSSQLKSAIQDNSICAIELAAGTYNLGPLSVTDNRTQPVTIRPAAGAEVIFSGDTSGEGAFDFTDGAGNINLEGIIFDGYHIGDTGIIWAGDAHDLNFNNLTFRNSTGQTSYKSWAFYLSMANNKGVTNITANNITVTGQNKTISAITIGYPPLSNNIKLTNWNVSDVDWVLHTGSGDNVTNLTVDGWKVANSGKTDAAVSFSSTVTGTYKNICATNSLGLNASAGMVNGGNVQWNTSASCP